LVNFLLEVHEVQFRIRYSVLRVLQYNKGFGCDQLHLSNKSSHAVVSMPRAPKCKNRPAPFLGCTGKSRYTRVL